MPASIMRMGNPAGRINETAGQTATTEYTYLLPTYAMPYTGLQMAS